MSEKCPHHVRRNHTCPICARISESIIGSESDAPVAQIVLKSGVELTPEQAQMALDEAITIIDKLGATGAWTGETIFKAEKWMMNYYPQW